MIQELEKLVREGNFAEAKRQLRKMNLKKMPRNMVRSYANLARRVGLGKLSLRALAPIVRGNLLRKGQPADPTPEEKIEYAATLREEGAITEAEQILMEVDVNSHPQVNFQLALCKMAQWDYTSAIPLLLSHSQSFAGPAYARSVSQVNLLTAFVHEGEYHRASDLVVDLHRELKESNSTLLLQRSFEYAAQLEIARHNWDQALQYLQESEQLLNQATDSIYTLYLRKWFAIAHSMREQRIRPELLEVKTQAAEQGAWEVVRDCDFYIGQISRDEGILLHVYFGTPFPSYRKKIEEILTHVPDRFFWGSNRFSSAHDQSLFDLVTAQGYQQGLPTQSKLVVGQALHRFLIILCQDFYRPVALLSLFSNLFPNETFNPFSSPNRVHSIIKRFRRCLTEISLPIEILEIDGGYKLNFTGDMYISIPRRRLPLSQQEIEFSHLCLKLERPEFTARQAAEAIGASKSEVQRLLKWAVQKGKVDVEGQRTQTFYRRRAG